MTARFCRYILDRPAARRAGRGSAAARREWKPDACASASSANKIVSFRPWSVARCKAAGPVTYHLFFLLGDHELLDRRSRNTCSAAARRGRCARPRTCCARIAPPSGRARCSSSWCSGCRRCAAGRRSVTACLAEAAFEALQRLALDAEQERDQRHAHRHAIGRLLEIDGAAVGIERDVELADARQADASRWRREYFGSLRNLRSILG